MRYQYASDVDRDGLGLELLDGAGNVVAEVFRCDADHTLSVNTFAHDVSVGDLEELLARARAGLGPFEDGTPLAQARSMPPRPVALKR